MAVFKNLDERYHILGIKTYADITTSATNLAYVDMSKYNSVAFLLGFGTSDTEGTLKMEQSTQLDSDGTEAGLGFHYRLTGAAGVDTMGTITYINSDSTVTYAAADDNKYWVLEPDQLADGYRYCRVVITPSGTSSATPIWCVAILTGARYAQNTMLTAS